MWWEGEGAGATHNKKDGAPWVPLFRGLLASFIVSLKAYRHTVHFVNATRMGVGAVMTLQCPLHAYGDPYRHSVGVLSSKRSLSLVLDSLTVQG